MFKKYSKKVMVLSALLMGFLMFISEVSAASYISHHFFYEDDGGMTIEVQSDSKYSGYVYLQASRNANTRYYDGIFRFVLYKKGIINYSEYGRKMKNTYNDCNITAAWDKMSTTYYKGTLQLYEADTSGQYSGITTSFGIFQN